MEDNKVSKAQRKATKNWEQENKDHANYLKSRSAARSFIRNRATLEDLAELELLINAKRLELE